MLGTCKSRIVKLIDQTNDAEKIKQGTTLAMISGKDLVKDSLKKEYLRKYTYQQLKLCQEVSSLEPFILPTCEQLMDNDQTLLSFLLKQQNQTMATENPLIFDFKAPLEFEIMLIKDSVW